MMVWSINLLVLSVGLLIVGMIKPNWILFWMEKPGRLPIILLSTVLFMVSVVMFGEANKEKNTMSTNELSQNKTDKVPVVVEEAIKETK